MVFTLRCDNVRREAKGLEEWQRFVGARLREARRQRGLNQKQLAKLAGIDRGYLGEIEQGSRNPTFNVMCRLACACEVEVTYFVPPHPDKPQTD
jgi:transcriptional regulator with XRE-family HTH domain